MQKILFLIIFMTFSCIQSGFAANHTELIKQSHDLAISLQNLSTFQTDSTCRSELYSASISSENAGKELANNASRQALFLLKHSLKSLNYTIALTCEQTEEIRLTKDNLVQLMFDIGNLN